MVGDTVLHVVLPSRITTRNVQLGAGPHVAGSVAAYETLTASTASESRPADKSAFWPSRRQARWGQVESSSNRWLLPTTVGPNRAIWSKRRSELGSRHLLKIPWGDINSTVRIGTWRTSLTAMQEVMTQRRRKNDSSIPRPVGLLGPREASLRDRERH